ncbi:tetratricopeptide repeat protein 39A-like protein [Leptotrombidium deliense]|uniref:Tetratricopeptide repeat protein 39A-like protein n=1 Tax=Leptotrombidium deliense TaxID=299467 RepID=A0A443S310_9ACAR|nr:tetratricopeptide repeat protein 39A-like protein [Leptotrombidium deliense]
MFILQELFYIWNCIFALKTQSLAESFMKRIEAKIKLFDGDAEKHESMSFLVLIKGVLFRNLDRDEHAVQCFKAVIEAGKGIKKDTFIVPHAILELGTTYLKMKNFEEANEYLHRAKNDYEKFLNESIVNLRVSSALRQLQIMEDSTRL